MQTVRPHFNVKAVLAGWFVNLVTGMVLLALFDLGLLMAVLAMKGGHVPHDQVHAVGVQSRTTLTYFVGLLVTSAFSDFLGGYTSGKIARHDHALQGIAVGIISCIVSGLLSWHTARTHPSSPSLHHPIPTLLTYILAIPSTYLGACFARMQRRAPPTPRYEGPLPMP